MRRSRPHRCNLLCSLRRLVPGDVAEFRRHMGLDDHCDVAHCHPLRAAVKLGRMLERRTRSQALEFNCDANLGLIA